jgi:hypothetical protein
MAAKVKISEMLNHYAPHAVVTNGKAPASPPANQWGYTMGGDGRVATLDYLTARAKSSYPSTWESYVTRTKKWIGRPVHDCNALAEAFHKKVTGVNIDTKARSNYANWCSPKSPTAADKKLTGIPQLPGVAVFSGPSASGITHVGFLLYKYGSGPLDWYVLEARGADYGLVVTKLTERDWAWWGVMSKYFDYDAGANWKPGQTATAPAAPAPAKATPFYAACSGQGVNIRTGCGTGNASLGLADKGAKMLALPAVSDWCEVSAVLNGKIVTGYMHSQYVKEVQ